MVKTCAAAQEFKLAPTMDGSLNIFHSLPVRYLELQDGSLWTCSAV